MSHKQPRRAEYRQEPLNYGDVFDVSGDLASRPIAPQDAAMMQAAETRVYGRAQRGGPAAAMQYAANLNERAGLVDHTHASDVAAKQGVTVMETDIPGARIFTESIGGQVVYQTVESSPAVSTDITIGDALEAVGQTRASNKPVERSDAAAIQAAELRATGVDVMIPGGVAAAAQTAASLNAQIADDEEKIKLGDILMDATSRLPADKAATREDAEGVMGAELRNNPNVRTRPGGVAAAVAAAVRFNEQAEDEQ